MLRVRSTARGSLLAAGTALALSGSAPAFAADDVHFILDWIPTGEHAAYYAGKAKGFFEDEDIDIRISRGYGSGDTVAKLSGGAGDFGIADIAAVMTARQRQDAPVKTISIIYTHSPHSLFVLESSDIEGFKGLEGKQIGITPGNSHKLYFPKVAERAGTDPSRIEWITVDASSMAAMLISGRLDAAPFYSIHHYYQNKQAEQMGEKINVLPFVETGFTIYSGSLFTTEEQIENNPDLVERFIRAVRTSWEFARDNQQEACQLHVEANPEVDLDDCQGSLEATLGFVFNEHSEKTGLGRYDPERLQFTYSVVAEAQELDPEWNPENAVDIRFLPEEE